MQHAWPHLTVPTLSTQYMYDTVDTGYLGVATQAQLDLIRTTVVSTMSVNAQIAAVASNAAQVTTSSHS